MINFNRLSEFLPMNQNAQSQETINLFRELVEPRKEILDVSGIKIPIPHAPYPANQPPVRTKELDNALRNIRSIAPGAGTNVESIRDSPPIDYLIDNMHPSERKRLLSGFYDPNHTNLLGLFRKKANDVYVNPNSERFDNQSQESVLAHELTHSIPRGFGIHYGEKKAEEAQAIWDRMQRNRDIRLP